MYKTRYSEREGKEREEMNVMKMMGKEEKGRKRRKPGKTEVPLQSRPSIDFQRDEIPSTATIQSVKMSER